MTDFYFTISDGMPVKTDLDLDLIDDAPEAGYGWLLWSFVKLRSSCDNGLATEEEEALLYEMRHGLIERLHGELNLVFAGSRITDGWFELYFYAPSPKRYENLVAELMKEYPQYAYESGTRKDPKWEHYLRHLYPSARQFQQIASRQTVVALSEEEDDLHTPRPVEHYLFFKTRSNEERFTRTALQAGFTAKEQIDHDDEDYPYGIVLERISAVDMDTIEEEVDTLFELAAVEHGHYEGWSTILAEEADV